MEMGKKMTNKTEFISIEEFIDCITDGEGEQIKKDLKRVNTKKE